MVAKLIKGPNLVERQNKLVSSEIFKQPLIVCLYPWVNCGPPCNRI